ncbi:cytochrome P450 [Wolfiporia cocos MD-104 SS10]|uniref:Cytochrome P450 n=1 Tax=Wolfiporia cocos (strain MD-104) TaxID=742152 RepID=A0A2H3JG12_WOLCO|nr:cytochrome P450 [Wolfiporia cocos MD-104 SS10]
MNQEVVASAVLAILLPFIWFLRISPQRPLNLPPGPKRLPLLGNILQLPSTRQEVTFGQWGRKYGDIVYARFFNTPAIIINSLSTAQDLLATRSKNYSDRPRFVYLDEMTEFRATFTEMSTTERFRKHRAWMRAAFGDKSALDKYRPLQLRALHALIAGLFATPERFEDHLKIYAGTLMMEITYGHAVTSTEDAFVDVADQALQGVVAYGPPGTTHIDFMPILKYVPSWIPGIRFRKEAERIRRLVRQMMDVPFALVRDQMASGSATPSLTASLLEEISGDGQLTKEAEGDIVELTGLIYAAGTETTTATLLTFLLAMVVYPDVLAKAQQEMDRVIGAERLPDLEDRDNLPYLECILKETYRWRVVNPLAIPHCSLSDDVYRGYDIPARSIIIPNLWYISHDPEMYPEPSRFYPERFEEKEDGRQAAVDPRTFVFGFGRRICPGRFLADIDVWLAMANIIATSHIGKAHDEAGKEIPPEVSFTSGFTSRPHEYRCDIKPRSTQALALVSQFTYRCY